MGEPAIAAMAGDWNPEPKERTFQPGDLVSARFEILKFIAEGGMGEVYAAKDFELGINVALKTIRSEIASDPRALIRFKQELHLSRRITHPNVCRVFDLAHHRVTDRDITYLTMELLEGETLADRLRRGRMTTEEALPLIEQMAQALEAAHSVGVIHRDFKPSNVMLCTQQPSTDSGPLTRAVITDFGLAHSFSTMDVLASLTHSGQILGTLVYMAPEQAEGKEVTPAADIYALGLVMFEMITGSRPFASDGPLGGVIQRLKEPPPTPKTLVPEIEPVWVATILRCLQAQPDKRFRTVHEISTSLQFGRPGRHIWNRQVQQLLSINPVRKILYFTGLALFLILVPVLWVQRGKWLHESHMGSQTPIKLQLNQFTADGGVTVDPSLSSDGKMVVYSSDRSSNGNLNIWMQPVDEGNARQVTHESFDSTEPALSADGSAIAFRSEGDGGIYLVSSAGGTRKRLAENGRNPKFSPDGKEILYWSGDWTGETSNPSFAPSGKMFILSINRGIALPFQRHFLDARYPSWCLDGKHVLFQGAQDASASVLSAADWWIADSSHPEKPAIKTDAFRLLQKYFIVPEEFPAEWWENSIIFSGRLGQSINLFRIHVSPETLQVIGEPERLTFGTGYESGPSVSSSGRLFFASVNAPINIWALTLTQKSKVGALSQLTAGASWDTRPSISLDGQKLAFARRWGNERNVWLRNLQTGSETSLTSSEVTDPLISRDGSEVAYSRYEEPQRATIEIALTNSSVRRRVCTDCGEPLDWSADGSSLLYSFGQPKAIGLLELGSGRKTEVVRRPNAASSASFCPQGQCITFAEWLDGTHSKLWLVPLLENVTTPLQDWVQLTDGKFADDKPRWSTDGKSLYFYSNRDGFYCLWKVAVDLEKHRVHGEPVAVQHLHRAVFSLRELPRNAFDLRVAGDKLVFNVVSTASNLWKTELRETIQDLGRPSQIGK